jgi:hypothetical protein
VRITCGAVRPKPFRLRVPSSAHHVAGVARQVQPLDAAQLMIVLRAAQEFVRRQHRAAAAERGQQRRVEPGVDLVFVHQQRAGDADQRKPQAERDPEPAVQRGGDRVAPHRRAVGEGVRKGCARGLSARRRVPRESPPRVPG